MTKYAELCEVASKALWNYNEYRDCIGMFAVKMVQGLRDYLGVPRGMIWAATIDDPHTKLDPYKAPKLGDDGRWEMAIVVRYEFSSGPIQPSLPSFVQEGYPLIFSKQGNGFKVEFAHRKFAVGMDDDLNPCFDAYNADMRKLVERGIYGTQRDRGAPELGFHTFISQPEKSDRDQPPIGKE